MEQYWNINSTTRIRPEVSQLLCEVLNTKSKYFLNPSDISTSCRYYAKRAIDKARVCVKNLINAAVDDNIIFTSSGSESNNFALEIGRNYVGKEGLIISSVVEHDSINFKLDDLAKQGYNIVKLDVDSLGRIDYSQLKKLDFNGKVFISIMLVNNELGNIYDLKRIVEISKSKWKNCLVHTDAVQAMGKIDVDVKTLGVDMLSLSGHKIGAPAGVGSLYVKKGIHITPLIFGHQECAFRGGTENTAYIMALGKAAEITKSQMTEYHANIIKTHRDRIEQGILSVCKELGFEAGVNGDVKNRVNNTSSIYIKGIYNVDFVINAEEFGLYFSVGAACNSSVCSHEQSGSDEPVKASPVLKAIHHPDYKSVIRISIGDEFFFYTAEDVKKEKHMKAYIDLDVEYGLAGIKNLLKKQQK